MLSVSINDRLVVAIAFYRPHSISLRLLLSTRDSHSLITRAQVKLSGIQLYIDFFFILHIH